MPLMVPRPPMMTTMKAIASTSSPICGSTMIRGRMQAACQPGQRPGDHERHGEEPIDVDASSTGVEGQAREEPHA